MTKKRLLLHICCAPDATIPWPELISEEYETAGYFYGGNIHPAEEYERRLEAVRALAAEQGSEIAREHGRGAAAQFPQMQGAELQGVGAKAELQGARIGEVAHADVGEVRVELGGADLGQGFDLEHGSLVGLGADVEGSRLLRNVGVAGALDAAQADTDAGIRQRDDAGQQKARGAEAKVEVAQVGDGVVKGEHFAFAEGDADIGTQLDVRHVADFKLIRQGHRFARELGDESQGCRHGNTPGGADVAAALR